MRDNLETVRALLIKAEAEGVTKAEAEALTDKAALLMAKYGIDSALAQAREQVRVVPVNTVIAIDNPFSSAKSSLFAVVAQAFNCSVIILNKHSLLYCEGKTTLHVFGYQSDIDAVHAIYTSLLLQGTQASLNVPPGEKPRSYRTSFWYGFAGEVRMRMQRVSESVMQERTPGTDIVLRDRKTAVEAAMRDKYPRTRQLRRTYSSSAGFNSGKAAGQRANLHNRHQAEKNSRQSLTA